MAQRPPRFDLAPVGVLHEVEAGSDVYRLRGMPDRRYATGTVGAFMASVQLAGVKATPYYPQLSASSEPPIVDAMLTDESTHALRGGGSISVRNMVFENLWFQAAFQGALRRRGSSRPPVSVAVVAATEPGTLASRRANAMAGVLGAQQRFHHGKDPNNLEVPPVPEIYGALEPGSLPTPVSDAGNALAVVARAVEMFSDDTVLCDVAWRPIGSTEESEKRTLELLLGNSEFAGLVVDVVSKFASRYEAVKGRSVAELFDGLVGGEFPEMVEVLRQAELPPSQVDLLAATATGTELSSPNSRSAF
jgi:hypothetical protein